MRSKFLYPAIVLDQGPIRDQGLIEKLLLGNPSASIIVPDVTFSELAIKRNPERSFQESLKFLKPFKNRCFAAVGIEDAAKWEVANKRSATRFSLVDKRATQALHELIVGGGDGYDRVIAAAESHDAEHKSYFKQEAIKEDLIRLNKLFIGALKPELAKKLASSKTSEEAKLGVVCAVVARLSPGNRLYQNETARRYLYARLIQVLTWAEHSTITVKSSTALNDFFDLDFVVLSSFFDDFRTSDGGTRLKHQRLMRILEAKGGNNFVRALDREFGGL